MVSLARGFVTAWSRRIFGPAEGRKSQALRTGPGLLTALAIESGQLQGKAFFRVSLRLATRPRPAVVATLMWGFMYDPGSVWPAASTKLSASPGRIRSHRI